MTRYLISFAAGAMDHIPDQDMPAVGKASHEVVQQAVNAGCGSSAAGWRAQGRASWPPTGR
jgi:hydroxyethylthiazole kinase-like sugar kinase family protein